MAAGTRTARLRYEPANSSVEEMKNPLRCLQQRELLEDLFKKLQVWLLDPSSDPVAPGSHSPGLIGFVRKVTGSFSNPHS